jgi:hypothetical protein
MNSQNYSTTYAVDRTPEEVFAAINNVRAWWIGEIEGRTDALNEEFTYRHEDVHYSKQKITEFIPAKKVVWTVIDAQLNFVDDKNEWTGTEIVFDIAKNGDKTTVRFTHQGLVPAFECFDACSNAWGFYINDSLWNLINADQTETASG